MYEYEEQPRATGPESQLPRKAQRSRTNRVIAGVAGGLGEYLGLDPILIRIAFVALALASGAGLILYLVAWIAMPRATEGPEEPAMPAVSLHQARMILGGALVALGAFLLLRISIPWFDARLVWSALLIAVGAMILAKGFER
ncbi:MAG TPA: PspC domain-containing protein [Thermomicrobiaceae bacterium]|nr:PspC domain-containing protein [Thermomicrobiaceae bacterium]